MASRGLAFSSSSDWGEPELAPHRRVECSQSIYYIWYVRHPRAAIYITRVIFRRPHEQTSALFGTTCIIIAESAKQIQSIFTPVYTMSSTKNYQSSSASESAEERRQIRLQRRRE